MHWVVSTIHLSEEEIRLKNLKSKVVTAIKTRFGDDYIIEFSKKIDSILSDTTFLEHQTEGLLICACPGRFEMFYLPFDTNEYIAVADHFHLAPVLGLVNDYREYYVLMLTQRHPALLKGDLYGLYPTNLQLPESLKAGLGIDENGRENEQQWSVSGANQTAGGISGFNGRGSDKNPARDDRLRFWRLIDQLVVKHTNRDLPLILAGVTREVAEYRALSRYPNLLPQHIDGGSGKNNLQELYRSAMDVVRHNLIDRDHNQAIKQYLQLSGKTPRLTEADHTAILTQADAGRIDKLLLAAFHYTSDTIRDNNRPVPVISYPSPEYADDVNKVAQTVLNEGGKVINLDHASMPVKDVDMLAILRY